MKEADELLEVQGSLLQAYRRKLKLTQHQVAVSLDINRSTVAMLENGDRGKKSESLFKLLRLYGILPDELHKQVMEIMEVSIDDDDFDENDEWYELKTTSKLQSSTTINDFKIRELIEVIYGMETLRELGAVKIIV
ncbi:MAG TPA: helix-turn-helix transcriptional regulator [Bacteriovoracaceae bacterium]|nr:helix-turn-helix transcriptional regulator [Bacteriovoracaceae bacterium]